MKIERINENQIRCTLTKEDLLNRHLRISELAYGSEKAKALFKDMMEQASAECGFEAEYIPLMIEAVPVAPDSLVLIITKIEDPEELDTRFSSFTQHPDDAVEDNDTLPSAYADEILHCFDHIEKILKSKGINLSELSGTQASDVDIDTSSDSKKEASLSVRTSLAKVYTFSLLETIRKLSAIISPFYKGENTLYKDSSSGEYFLVVQMSDHTPAEFNKICNIISEFGKTARTDYASTSYYNEHFNVIIDKTAVQTLAKL